MDHHWEDTLFLVFEEDWRLLKKHEEPLEVNTPILREAIQPKSLPPRRDEEEMNEEEPSASSSSWQIPTLAAGEEPDVDHRLTYRAGKVKGDVAIQPSLKDLVRYATIASRSGKGDLVWATWCGNKKTPGEPTHFSGLLMLTRTGAGIMRDLMLTSSPDHFDLWLLRFLKLRPSPFPASSYVWPSIGHFCSHRSGCAEELHGGVRESGWEAKWVGEGTRWCRQGHRFLCHFQDRQDKWLTKAINDQALDGSLYLWKTLKALPGRHDLSEEEGVAKYGDKYIPGLKTALATPGPKSWQSKRQRRQGRLAAQQYIGRHFVDDWEQVFPSGPKHELFVSDSRPPNSLLFVSSHHDPDELSSVGEAVVEFCLALWPIV